MFESYEKAFCIRCRDVGLICNHTIFGASENEVMENAIVHMFDYHAINPEEMTTCMRLKISQNIYEMSPQTSITSNRFHYQNAGIVPSTLIG